VRHIFLFDADKSPLSSSNLYATGGTFALYSLLCRHANIMIIPNQDQTDEKLTTYSRSKFSEQSFAARTKRWLEENAFKKNALLVLVLIGSCMVIGDGILTPAISGIYLSYLNP
jgi:KUP system potassium uptake protein